MSIIIRQFALIALLIVALSFSAMAQDAAVPGKGSWSANGVLFESCTCAVPCSCNFGEPPSPHNYCYAVFAYRLDKAQYDAVDLSGFIVAAADGPNGGMGWIDDRATPAQRILLTKLARKILDEGGAAGNNVNRPFQASTITVTVQNNELYLKIGNAGGFRAKLIIGRDGKNPVVVENNTVWPIARSAKGKSSQLTLNDKNAGKIDAQNVNANYGQFVMEGKVVTAAVNNRKGVRVARRGCCAAKSCCAAR